jgi:zinc/manganese transport system substrate-binding protein/manganese/iron transport system substrate-binding protein
MTSVRSSRTLLGIIGALAIVVAACGDGAGSASPGNSAATVRVVTTTTVFADIVANVGGERVDVASIIPPGVGPEDYEPKPDDAKRLADADLIVSNGVGLDDYLDDLLASGDGGADRLVLGEGIPPIEDHGAPNPHFWLDPTLVRDHYLPAIVAKLIDIDPAGVAAFEASAAAYSTALEGLDAELKAKVAEIPEANRKLVTAHDAFPYFARHFGFELVGVIVDSVGQEPTASELAALVETVKQAGVTAIFSEAQFNPKLSETLAREAGITEVVTTLYNDALGSAPADTYVGMMRWNVDQIVAALRD